MECQNASQILTGLMEMWRSPENHVNCFTCEKLSQLRLLQGNKAGSESSWCHCLCIVYATSSSKIHTILISDCTAPHDGHDLPRLVLLPPPIPAPEKRAEPEHRRRQRLQDDPTSPYHNCPTSLHPSSTHDLAPVSANTSRTRARTTRHFSRRHLATKSKRSGNPRSRGFDRQSQQYCSHAFQFQWQGLRSA